MRKLLILLNFLNKHNWSKCNALGAPCFAYFQLIWLTGGSGNQLRTTCCKLRAKFIQSCVSCHKQTQLQLLSRSNRSHQLHWTIRAQNFSPKIRWLILLQIIFSMNHKTVILRFAHIWSCLSPSRDSPNMADAGHFENMCSAYLSQISSKKCPFYSWTAPFLVCITVISVMSTWHFKQGSHFVHKKCKFHWMNIMIMDMDGTLKFQCNLRNIKFFLQISSLLTASNLQSIVHFLKLFDRTFFAKCDTPCIKYYCIVLIIVTIS